MFKKRWLLVFTALVLVLLLVPACGGGGGEKHLHQRQQLRVPPRQRLHLLRPRLGR